MSYSLETTDKEYTMEEIVNLVNDDPDKEFMINIILEADDGRNKGSS